MKFEQINERAKLDPHGFIMECEAEYHKKITDAARKIATSAETCPIVLLSGPSGSGKTTSSRKLERALEEFGIGTHSVSLDDYFNTVDEKTVPRTESGDVDYESPFCLDLDLLGEQIQSMIAGDEVLMPKFDFPNQCRMEQRVPLRRRKNEVIIMEGIHALNDLITKHAGEHGVKLYVSARSCFNDKNGMMFKGTWVRLMRRLVRDNNFRGTTSEFTLGIWGTIREGEKKYISPFKDRADIVINSTHPYEVNMIKKYAYPLVENIPQGVKRYKELCEIAPALERFYDIDDALVPEDSLLREFIGGGNFNY
ncbi:MAG: nucleoside kinase [Clostridia bacterium]|nr:nucleoside kinase [Clostridia bacterium]